MAGGAAAVAAEMTAVMKTDKEKIIEKQVFVDARFLIPHPQNCRKVRPDGVETLYTSFVDQGITMTMSNLKVMQMSEADIATHFPNLEEVRKEAAPWMEDWHARVWSTSEWDAPEDIQKKYDKYVTMPMWTIDGGHRTAAGKKVARVMQVAAEQKDGSCSGVGACLAPILPCMVYKDLSDREILALSSQANTTTGAHVASTLHDNLVTVHKSVTLLKQAIKGGQKFEIEHLTRVELQRFMDDGSVPHAYGGPKVTKSAASTTKTSTELQHYYLTIYIELVQWGGGMSDESDSFKFLKKDNQSQNKLTINALKPLITSSCCTAGKGWTTSTIHDPVENVPVTCMCFVLSRYQWVLVQRRALVGDKLWTNPKHAADQVIPSALATFWQNLVFEQQLHAVQREFADAGLGDLTDEEKQGVKRWKTQHRAEATWQSENEYVPKWPGTLKAADPAVGSPINIARHVVLGATASQLIISIKKRLDEMKQAVEKAKKDAVEKADELSLQREKVLHLQTYPLKEKEDDDVVMADADAAASQSRHPTPSKELQDALDQEAALALQLESAKKKQEELTHTPKNTRKKPLDVSSNEADGVMQATVDSKIDAHLKKNRIMCADSTQLIDENTVVDKLSRQLLEISGRDRADLIIGDPPWALFDGDRSDPEINIVIVVEKLQHVLADSGTMLLMVSWMQFGLVTHAFESSTFPKLRLDPKPLVVTYAPSACRVANGTTQQMTLASFPILVITTVVGHSAATRNYTSAKHTSKDDPLRMFSQHPPFANVISHYQPPGPGHYIAMPKASKTKRWEWMLAAVSRSPSKCDEIHRAFFPPTGKFEFEEEKVNEIITKMDSAAAEKTITKEAQTWWRNQSSEFEKEMKKEGGKKDGGKRDYNRDTHLRNGEKSRELIQLLINRYLPNDPSRKNPLVMDPFAGTLSVACVCADRADPIPCLSIDLDPYVLYKGAERLRKVAGKLIDTSIWLEKLHLKVKNSSLYHLSGSGSRMSDAESPVPSCDGEKVFAEYALLQPPQARLTTCCKTCGQRMASVGPPIGDDSAETYPMAWEKKACNFSDHYCSQPCSVETTAAVHPSPVTDKEYDLKSAEVMFYGAIPGDGFKPISEPSQATAYNGQLQKEAELYGFVTLVTTDDKSAPPVDYVAEKNIPVGEVIAGLTGLAMTYHFDLDDAGDRDQQWQLFRKHSTGVDVLDFTNVMEAGHAGWGVTRRALLIPTHSSLGARFPPPPTGQTANAKLIAHPTLALELSSPLQKHQTVVPGTFVVVSLREIKLHEPIYVDHTTSSDGVMVDGVASTAEATSLAELQKVCRLREIQLVDEIVNDLAHWNPAHKSTVTASKAKRKLDLGTVRQHVWPGDNSINTLTGSPEAADEALIRQAVAAMQRSLPLVSFLKEASPLAATCLQQLDTIQFYDVQRYCSAENKGSDAADKKRTGRASGRGEVDWTVDQYREWVRQSHVGFLRVRTISGLLPVLPSMDFDLRIRSLRDKQSSELAAAAKLSPEDEASMDDSAKQAASEKLQAALAAKRTLCDANYTALLKTIKTENGPWLKRLAAFNKYYEKLTGVVRASSSSAVGVSAIASWAKQWSAWTADVGWNTLVEEWKEHIQTPLSLPRLTGYFGSIKNSSPRPDPEVLKDIWIPVKDLVDEADQPALDSDLLEFPLGAFFRLGKLDAISLESLESFLVVLEYVLRDRKGLLSSFLKREDKCIFDACPGLTGAGVLWHIARMATNLMSAIRVAKAEKADEAPEDLTAATSTFNSLPAHTTELASCTENVQTATVNYPTFKDITNGEYPFLTQLSHSTATPTIPALLKGHIRVVCGYQIPVGSAVPLEDLNAVNEWNSKLAKSRTDVLESKCSASGAHEALMPGTVQPTDAEFGAIDIYAGTIREQLSSSKRPRLAESKTEESKTEEPKTEESKTASELSDARADGSASNAMAD